MFHSYKFSKKILRFAQDDSKQTKDDNKQRMITKKGWKKQKQPEKL